MLVLKKFPPFASPTQLIMRGYGFVVTSSLIRIGQNFNIINTPESDESKRKINPGCTDLDLSLSK
jgi:hypothetical protein